MHKIYTVKSSHYNCNQERAQLNLYFTSLVLKINRDFKIQTIF